MIGMRAVHTGFVLAFLGVAFAACTQQLDLGTQSTRTDDAAMPEDTNGAGGQAPIGGTSAGGGGGTSAGGGGGASGGRGGQGGLACETTMFDVPFDPGRPFAFVAVQRSTSMLEKVGERSKLELVGHVLGKTFSDRRLPVGFVQFPGYQPLCDAEASCCSTDILLTPKADAGRMIERLVLCQEQPSSCFQTVASVPTAAALQRVRVFIKGLNVPGRRTILLFTDSDPACGGQSVCDQTIAETAGLFQEDVDTFVLPLGASSAQASCLPRIARAGDTLPVDAPLPAITSEPGLYAAVDAALDTIEKGFCELSLRFASRQPEQLRVFIDGVEVPRAGAKPSSSSFMFAKGSSTRITINGAACETLKRRPADIRIYQACCASDRDCRP